MPRNDRQKRRPAEVMRDSVKISEMYKEGAYQAVIAYELGISQSTVSREIEKLKKQWQKDSTDNIDAAKARELARIDNLELVYWNGWLRSQADAESTTSGTTPKGKIDTKTVKGQVGDSSFLQGVERCIKLRLDILGITKGQTDGPSGAIELVVKYATDNKSTQPAPSAK